MACSLSKHIESKATHWVGDDGTLYDYKEFLFIGKPDLPPHNYPYTVKYEKRLAFLCCRLCDCENKPEF